LPQTITVLIELAVAGKIQMQLLTTFCGNLETWIRQRN